MLIFGNCGHGALGRELAAVDAGLWPELDHVVGATNGFFVVLDHNEGIAEVDQTFERSDQGIDVAAVETDTGLI